MDARICYLGVSEISYIIQYLATYWLLKPYWLLLIFNFFFFFTVLLYYVYDFIVIIIIIETEKSDFVE